MTARGWWTRTTARRNPKRCICQIEEQGHLVATKRGAKRCLGTQHGAAHRPDCPHSELNCTTKILTPDDQRRLDQMTEDARQRKIAEYRRARASQARREQKKTRRKA